MYVGDGRRSSATQPGMPCSSALCMNYNSATIGLQVFSQGDAADKWYVLLQGTLLVTVASDASSERELCRLSSPSRPTNSTHLNQLTLPHQPN